MKLKQMKAVWRGIFRRGRHNAGGTRLGRRFQRRR